MDIFKIDIVKSGLYLYIILDLSVYFNGIKTIMNQ